MVKNIIIISIFVSFCNFSSGEEKDIDDALEKEGLSEFVGPNKKPLFLIKMKPGEVITKDVRGFSLVRLGVGISGGGDLVKEFRGTRDVALEIENIEKDFEILGTSFTAESTFKNFTNGVLKLKLKNNSKKSISFVIYSNEERSKRIIEEE